MAYSSAIAQTAVQNGSATKPSSATSSATASAASAAAGSSSPASLKSSIANPYPHLLTYDELPHWRQDNHFITTAYRPTSYSLWQSFLSIFQIHNQFVNIHTHLLGALIFLFLPPYLYYHPSLPTLSTLFPALHDTWTSSDTIAISFFFLGAVLCLLTSSIYHMLCEHSPLVSRIGNQLDYVGIVFLITGSFIPSVYYGFYCSPHLQQLYWAMICSIGVGCTIVSVTPTFRSPQWRPVRAGMFVAMGGSAVVPMLHGIIIYGWQRMEPAMGLWWVMLQGGLYVMGAGFYALRIPEKWAPGRFDVWGSSHQIFHVLVVCAACAHLLGLLEAAEYAHRPERCGQDVV